MAIASQTHAVSYLPWEVATRSRRQNGLCNGAPVYIVACDIRNTFIQTLTALAILYDWRDENM